MTSCVVSLSGGVASWAAARRAVDRFGADNVTLLFADTMIEDADLYRFLGDVETHLGVPVTRIADGRDPWEVFRDSRYIGNSRVDPCSRVLKRELLRAWVDDQHPEPVTVAFGIDWTEAHRCERIAENYRPHKAWFPLIDDSVDKCQVFAELAAANIDAPRLYTLGFPHNNCGGFCVKAGQAQFALLFRALPERYAYHETKEAELAAHLGKPVSILRDRRGGTTTPMTLAAFRERIETGDYDTNEWGGCGCALDDGAPSQLALDLFAD